MILQGDLLTQAAQSARWAFIPPPDIATFKGKFAEVDLLEIMPPKYFFNKYKKIKKVVSEIGYLDRKQFLRKNASITSSDNGHVISFGEYAALYLLYWGNFRHKDYLNKNFNLSPYPNMSKLFANIPTYMIFDDHDVTDDWNIDEIWKNRVNKSVTGRSLISNAISAYWAFQGWGNDPEKFDSNFIQDISSFFKKSLDVLGKISDGEIYKFEDRVLLFDNWSFWAPTPIPSLFLDCRTCRESNIDIFDYKKKYYSDNGLGKPIELKIDGLVSFPKIDETLGKMSKSASVIVVIPTPIFGHKIFETIQEPMIANESFKANKLGGKLPGRYKWDLESWNSNPYYKGYLLQSLLNKFESFSHANALIFLSGDVHYSFSLTGFLSNKAGNKGVKFHQFTSSGINNSADEIYDILGPNKNFKGLLVDYYGMGDMRNQFNFSESFPHPINLLAYGVMHNDYPNDWIAQYYLLSNFSNIGLINLRPSPFHGMVIINRFLYFKGYNKTISECKNIFFGNQPIAEMHVPDPRNYGW